MNSDKDNKEKMRFLRHTTLMLKGVIVGFGGIAPGLSGSVLLIIFGIYQKTIEYLGSLFVDFKKKINFLLPLVIGMVTGVLLFSKLIDFMLTKFPMPTRYAFLGLILGTVPKIFKEVKKKGFSWYYYLVIIVAFVLVTSLFNVNSADFKQITDPTLLQSIVLGIAVVATAIIPGLDTAVVLSSMGLYEVYIKSLASMDLAVLLPMVIGVVVGALIISTCVTFLFNRFYTVVYSAIFGMFIAMMPRILNESCKLSFDGMSIISIMVMFVGLMVSFYLSSIQKKNKESEKE